MYDLTKLNLQQGSICLIKNKRGQKNENRQKTEDNNPNKSKTPKL